MFRQSIPSKSTVAERSFKTGSWDIGFTHNGTSVNDKFIKLCLLATCELLGTDVVCHPALSGRDIIRNIKFGCIQDQKYMSI